MSYKSKFAMVLHVFILCSRLKVYIVASAKQQEMDISVDKKCSPRI